MDFEEIYMPITLIVGVITFIVSYIYAIANYGFLLGVGLGWLPSLIVSVVVGFAWPLFAVILVGGAILIFALLYW